MSYQGAPNQYGEDAEIERQLQEEYRRRQAMQGQPQGGNQGMFQQQQQQQQQRPGENASSPYGYPGPAGRGGGAPGYPHHPSPYSHVTNPYAGIDARAYAAQQQGSGTNPQGNASNADAMAQMYAQQRRAQLAGSYGYAGAPGSRAALEQHYAAYGMAPPYSHDAYGNAASPHDYQQVASDPYHVLKSTNGPKGDDKGEDGDGTPGDKDGPKSMTLPKRGGSGKMKRPMLQKVTTTISKPKHTARVIIKDGITIIEDGDDQWYTGCVPLGVEDDKYWLSELQVYLRSNFAEAFGATEEDIAAPMHGRNKPIALGQVGIRCMHCKHDNPAERGQQATSYPSLISGIYNSVQQMLRLHLDCCLSMPQDVRGKIEQLKVSCSSRGGRKQYWIDSAKRLGLVDTPHGIHFGRNPLGPLPPLSGPSVNSKEGRTKKKTPPKAPASSTPSASAPAPSPKDEAEPEPEELPPPPPPVDDRPLVFPEDKPLISDYLYLTLEQMSPCCLMEADRVGCYKTRKVGFPGLACKHCVGQAGCGRYFPASEASLSQTTTSQTIMNHVRNCRRCPIEIRENLEIMKRSRMGPDGKRSDKPKHGGRKVFFHRLWCRIQDLPLEEEKTETVKKRKTRKGTAATKKRRKKSEEDSYGSEAEEEEEGSDAETESEGDSVASGEDAKAKSKKKAGKEISPWVHGCVRLTKTDDSNWLSEMECFARKDLIEVFTVKQDDVGSFSIRKEPAEGQVGIRCIFCKTLDPADRPNNYVSFSDSLSTLHTKVTDMIRLHFPSCPNLPDDHRSKFKALKGFDAKVATDDSQQYWVDSARDIGLANVPPNGRGVPGSWGITFRRDPLQPSPADELDLEQSNGTPVDFGKNSMIKEEDRGECTDQVMLLLRQVRPCQFKKSDRRAGPGSRGRDRSMGFPGLCCMHCVGRNTLGRYFPVSAKNLTDSTANSLSAHVASCAHCPEPIKASLAYLGHRSILQKAELSGSWKKSFFKKIWDRLHVDRGWTSIDDEVDATIEEDSGEEEQDGSGEDKDKEDDEEDAEEDGEVELGEDGKPKTVGNQMNALIKAAAIWLTNQDAATDKGGRGKGRNASKRGRGSSESAPAEEEEDDRKPSASKKRRSGRK